MDPKRIEPSAETALLRLIALARTTLDNTPKADELEIIVFVTSQENTYTIISSDPHSEDRVIQTMVAQGDTQISYLVCMWASHYCLDVPSYTLRKKLVALDRQNENALLVLRGEGHLVSRTIASTMPHK